MRWEPYEVARFAAGAGFQGDEQRTAVAVAVATSGGIASYDFTAGAPGAGHWIGLWGIDVDRWPDYATRDLHVPQEAATAAWELCRDHGGWSWSGEWRAGTHLHHFDAAGAACTNTYSYQRPGRPVTISQHGRQIRAGIERLAAVRAMLSNYQRPGV